MPKIDIAALKTDSHTGYPEPFRQVVLGRSRKRLGNAVGLSQFGPSFHPGPHIVTTDERSGRQGRALRARARARP